MQVRHSMCYVFTNQVNSNAFTNNIKNDKLSEHKDLGFVFSYARCSLGFLDTLLVTAHEK